MPTSTSPDRKGDDSWLPLGLAGVTPIAVSATLVCCALPIALVSLGLGSVMASLVSGAPWLATLSRHKEWAFLAAGLLLALNYWVLYRSSRGCEPGQACSPDRRLGRWLRRVHWGSVGLYGIGLAAAYLSGPLVQLLEG